MIVINVISPVDNLSGNDEMELTTLLAAIIHYRTTCKMRESLTEDEVKKGHYQQEKHISVTLATKTGNLLGLDVSEVYKLMEEDWQKCLSGTFGKK